MTERTPTGRTPAGADGDDVTVGAGSSSDQHVTGAPETGDFITDDEPTAGTPAHGSSNAGVNAVGGQRMEPADRLAERDATSPDDPE